MDRGPGGLRDYCIFRPRFPCHRPGRVAEHSEQPEHRASVLRHGGGGGSAGGGPSRSGGPRHHRAT